MDRVRFCYAVLAAWVLLFAVPGFASESGALVGFTITIGVEFETEEIAIPGWEGGPIFEPKGYAMIVINAGFPEAGGAAEVQSARVKLTRYTGVGPNCRLRLLDPVIGREFAPVVFRRLYWNREQNTIHISREVDFPEYELPVGVTCPPHPEITIPDRPLFKAFGPFIANLADDFQGFVLPLGSASVSSRTIKDVRYGEPMVYRANLDFVVERQGV
jgi:hypothetical protein